jgi:hypothetical protein
MKTIDLQHQSITIDELLQMASGEAVRLRSKAGGEFILEEADAFDREVEELAESKKFMTFLEERWKERGRVPIEDLERRLATPASGDEAAP